MSERNPSDTTPEEAQRALEDLPDDPGGHGTPGQGASDEPHRRKDRGEQGKPRPGTPDHGFMQGDHSPDARPTAVPE